MHRERKIHLDMLLHMLLLKLESISQDMCAKFHVEQHVSLSLRIQVAIMLSNDLDCFESLSKISLWHA